MARPRDGGRLSVLGGGSARHWAAGVGRDLEPSTILRYGIGAIHGIDVACAAGMIGLQGPSPRPMPATHSKIRFKAKLLRPADRAAGSSWTFLILPRPASAKLPTRGMTTVEGLINGRRFRAALEPDGQRSHWLKVSKKLREAAGAQAGDLVALEIRSVAREPERRVPADLRNALAGAPRARATWSDITPVARRDWIHWITSAKRAETRARRISNACDMLAAGKRRVCCFDRSGFYSKGFAAPKAAD